MLRPSEQRPSSQIQRVVRDGAVVYEKQYVTNDWDDDLVLVRQRARCEVELLRQLASCKQFGGRLGVVRIAEANPDEATISTYEVGGVNLQQFIHLEKNSRTELTPWFLAGRWLRKLQSLPVSSEFLSTGSRRDPVDIVDYCELRIRSLAEYDYHWPNETTWKDLRHTIEELRDQCGSEDLSPVWVHADYAPGNLMWDGRVLTPIDFAMVRSGTPLDDATSLIHRIEMSRIYRPWLRLPVTAIRRAVLRGLGTPNVERSAAYRLMMVKHQICRLHTYVRRPAKNFKQSLHDRWVRVVLRRCLQESIKSTLS